MTTRGLVIGNSHAGMLLYAMQGERTGALGLLALDFFAQPGDGPEGFEVQGTRLVPRDDKLIAFLDKIAAPPCPDLANYDFVIIVGCGLSIFAVVQTMTNVALVGSGKALWQEMRHGGQEAKPYKRPLVSPDCFHHIVRDRLSASVAIAVLGAVSGVCDIPVFVLPQPRPRTLLRRISRKGAGFAKTHKSGDGQLVSNTFDDMAQLVCHSTASCHFLIQPQETITDYIFTSEEFCTGALRLSLPGARQAKKDVLHANAQYGTLVLQQICDLLDIGVDAEKSR